MTDVEAALGRVRTGFSSRGLMRTLDARLVRVGRRLKHTKVEIFAMSGDDEELVAVALGTVTSRRSLVRPPDGSDGAGGDS